MKHAKLGAYGKFQAFTTDDGAQRAALAYLTAKRYAPSWSETPAAIPRGVTLVIAVGAPVGQRNALSIGILQSNWEG